MQTQRASNASSHLLPSLLEAAPDDYVYALHDYTAPPSSRTHIYLSFRAGCKIRVFNRDESGWWDGEVVMDAEGREVDESYEERYGEGAGGRGWFPSNFVEEEGAEGTGNDTYEEDSDRRISDTSRQSLTSNPSSTSNSVSSIEEQYHSSHSHTQHNHPSRSDQSQRPTPKARTSHWREAPRPTHIVTASEPITPHPIPSHAQQHQQQQHHHSSSSFTGKKAIAANDWQTEAEIVITLEPINQAMELIRSAVRVKKIAHLQPSTACAISAIRSLLLATDCLSRESSLLAQFPLLGKVRKTILANLAELVALARSASQHPNERHAGFGSSGLEGEEEMEEFREAELEGMLKSSEETFSNVRVFLRTLVRCGIALPERKDADHLSEVDEERLGIGGSGIGPSRIPHSRGNSSPGEVLFGRPGSRMGTEVRRERERGTNLQAKSMGDLRLARRPLRTEEDGSMSGRTGSGHARKSSSSSFLEVEGEGSSFRKGRSRLGQDAGSISSVSSIGSSADYHAAVHHRQASGDATRSRSQSQVETVDIIVGIGMTFDSLLSVTAALIGHVQCHTVASHPSSHALLVDLSRETIDKIRDLLAIVELVINHDSTARSHGREIIQLDQAKRQMYETTSALVEAAERVASTPFREIPTEEDEINRERLLASASVIMRPARECVRLVKVCGNRRESLEALGMGTGIGLGVVTDMRGLPERSVDFGSSEDVTIQPGHRRRESQASVASSRSTRNRELSSTSSSTSGSYGRSAGPYSAPLDKGFREQIEEQEEVMVTPAEQTARNRITRPGLLSTKTSPMFKAGAEFSKDNVLATPSGPRRRGRASSFSSPSHTPRLDQERSPRPPSRSMDLSAAGGDSAVLNTPRPGDETFERRPSVADSFTSETPSTTATPKPPRWWAGQQTKNIEDTPAVPSSHETLQLRSARDARFEDAPTPQKNQTLTREISPADMRMFLVAHDYNPKDIAFNSEGSLIGATLPVLLEKLTPHDGVADSTLWESFFLTFRLFSEPSQLLEAIEARFDIAPPVRMPLQPDTVRIWNEHKVIPIRRQLLLIVRSWLNTYWNAETDTVVLGPLVVLIEEKLCKAFPGEHTRLLDLINKHKRNSLPASSPAVRVRQLRSGSSASLSGTPYHRPTFSMTSSTAALPPTPIMNKQLFSSLKQGITTVHVTDFDALELARQFTLLESKLFCAIEPGELIRLGKHKADSLKTMSTLATRITGWVSDRILDEVDARRRTGLLKYFIKVSSRCLELQNFSTMFAILAALNSSTILRLKRTWDGLSNKYRNKMDELRNVIEHSRNHNAYRTRLKSAEGPVLPFLGLILSDITFTAEGNPSTRQSPLDSEMKLINFDKYVKLGRIVTEFSRFQQPFNLAILPDVQNWLTNVLAEKGSSSIDALYRKSLMLEPRQGTESISNSILDRPAWLGGRI